MHSHLSSLTNPFQVCADKEGEGANPQNEVHTWMNSVLIDKPPL